jgi:hypothetical protein
MDDVPHCFGVPRSEDAAEIESALWSASLEGCKDALPALRSTNDDADDRIHQYERNVHMSYHVSISGANCGGALGKPNSNPLVCSGQGGEEAQADREGNVMVDLIDYKVDPYKAAIRDHPDGGANSFFQLERHSGGPNIPHDKMNILLTCLSVIFLVVSFSSTKFVCCRSFSYIDRFDDRYSSSSRVGNVDVAAMSFLCVLVF